MDTIEITAATLDNPAMGTIAIVGTVNVNQELMLNSDPAWTVLITGTYTIRDSAGQESTATFTQAVTNPPPVASDDNFTTPITAGDAIALNVLQNDTA